MTGISIPGTRTQLPPNERRDDRAPTAIIESAIQEQLAKLDDDYTACLSEMQRILRNKVRLQAARDGLLGAMQEERKEDASEAQN